MPSGDGATQTTKHRCNEQDIPHGYKVVTFQNPSHGHLIKIPRTRGILLIMCLHYITPTMASMRPAVAFVAFPPSVITSRSYGMIPLSGKFAFTPLCAGFITLLNNYEAS